MAIFPPMRHNVSHNLQILLIYVLDSLFELCMEVTELSNEKHVELKLKEENGCSKKRQVITIQSITIANLIKSVVMASGWN